MKKFVLGGVLFGILVFAAVAQADTGTQPQLARPASFEQQSDLEPLVRRDMRVLFDIQVNGDTSGFATIYYNDPAIPLHPDYLANLELYGADARAIVATLQGGPVGTGDGYLTARVASSINRQRSVQAWAAVRATAAAEGREPSIDELPAGMSPIEPVTDDQWVEPDVHLFNVNEEGDQATADVAFGPVEAGGQLYSYVFERVNGTWYIAYMESSWSQGNPDYQDPNAPAIGE